MVTDTWGILNMASLEMTSFLFPKSAYVTARYHSTDHPNSDCDIARYIELSHSPYCPTSVLDLTAKHPKLKITRYGHARILAHPTTDQPHQRRVGDGIYDMGNQQSQLWIMSDIAVFAIRLDATPGGDAGHPILGYRVLCSARTHRRTLFFPFNDQYEPWINAPPHARQITEYTYVPTPTHPKGNTDMWLGDLARATHHPADSLAMRKQA